MTNAFLRAKHWQLFLLHFAIPIIIYLGFLFAMFTQLDFQDPSSPVSVNSLNTISFLPFILILAVMVQLGWLWTVGTALQKHVPEGISLKVKRFKVLLLIPTVYITVMSLLIGLILSRVLQTDEDIDPSSIAMILAIVTPLHFLSIFGILHSLYFVAKTLKTIELHREVSFSDFIGEFIMVWFFPIGVWILQPKINKLADK